jgi:hypothetical protein
MDNASGRSIGFAVVPANSTKPGPLLILPNPDPLFLLKFFPQFLFQCGDAVLRENDTIFVIAQRFAGAKP